MYRESKRQQKSLCLEFLVGPWQSHPTVVSGVYLHDICGPEIRCLPSSLSWRRLCLFRRLILKWFLSIDLCYFRAVINSFKIMVCSWWVNHIFKKKKCWSMTHIQLLCVCMYVCAHTHALVSELSDDENFI